MSEVTEETAAEEITGNNLAEIGAKVRTRSPRNAKMAKMTDEQIGQRAIELRDSGHPKYQRVRLVEGVGDIELGRVFANPLEDFGEVAGEQVRGLTEMVSSPIETAKSLGRAGLGLADRTLQSPRGRFDQIEDLLDQGVPPEEAEAVAHAGPPRLTSPEAEREVDQLVKTGQFRTSAAGFEENPLRFISDALDILPATGIKKAVGLPAQLAKLNAPTRFGLKAAGMALDPAGAVTEAPGLVARGGAAVGGAALDKAGEIMTNRKIRQGDVPFRRELLSSAEGFSSSLGGRFIRELRGRLQTQVPLPEAGGRTARFDDIWRHHRAADIADGTSSVLQKGFKAMDRWRKDMKDRYTDLTQRAFRTEEGPNTLKIRLDEMFPVLTEGLSEFGFEVVQNAKTKRFRVRAKERKTPGLTELGGDLSTITDIGSRDRRIIVRQFERFLNEPSEVFAHELHNLRMLLDDNIGKLAADGASGRTRALLSALRDGLVRQLELEMPPDYVRAMRAYSKEFEFMERADKELGLRPGMVRDQTGDIDMRDHATTLNRLGNVFSVGIEHAQRMRLLRKVEQFGEDGTITPALMGVISGPIAGSGLVVRSELSQIGRALIAAGLTAEFGGLVALPAFVVFSPRLMTEAIATLKDITNAPALRAQAQKIIDIAEKARDLNETTGGRLATQARISGQNMAQYLQRLEEESGTNLGDEPLFPSSKANPQLDLEALGSIPVGAMKLNEPGLHLGNPFGER